MDLLNWLSLAGICALGAMSPGPSLLIVLRSAASGLRQGLACALAHGAAIAIYAGLTAFGLAVLITRSPVLFNILQWAGAAMLVYLGWKALRAPAPNTAAANIPAPHQTVRRSALQGFGVAFFNPKVAVFFTALFSQFVAEQQALNTKLGMAALAAGIDAGWYCLIALAVYAGRNRSWVSKSAGHRMQQLFGLLLIGLAARLVLTL
ncbi:Threonine/homoserine/homoserine lactone efflux protein [Microbulbifer donghaiensis]|uniref:Threonine/homoserine/homoserine lactone efflux protein n=1 Tax=Microbulbifer donghaiensis TaxID=494016 RepID=A0A1M4W011_9GAMM|nr:LysE family translocator [Microbulbifer donghaiensis]SHE74591.1 Threonine/homoserine/homoserine lactone efflux protein [Microbulbifer donghaiensis]